jgi:hypothetical protein
MRKRTDKAANPKMIADKIWKTIDGYDIREDLQETLSKIEPSFFQPKPTKKRLRTELSDEDLDYFD